MYVLYSNCLYIFVNFFCSLTIKNLLSKNITFAKCIAGDHTKPETKKKLKKNV